MKKLEQEYIDKVLGIVTKKLDTFSKYETVECSYYTSEDQELVKKYWGRGDTSIGDSKFEVLIFEHQSKWTHKNPIYIKNHMFVKFPFSKFFVQLKGQGFNGCGTMQTSSFEDVWCTKVWDEITIYRSGLNLHFSFNSIGGHDFMKCRARNLRGRNDHYSNEINTELLDKIFRTAEYIELPDNIMRIDDICHNVDEGCYYIFYTPSYEWGYDTFKFIKVDENFQIIEEMEITNVTRYRDGGTTNVSLIDANGKKHFFHSPTSFKKDESPAFDDMELVKIDRNSIDDKLVNLGIVTEKMFKDATKGYVLD